MEKDFDEWNKQKKVLERKQDKFLFKKGKYGGALLDLMLAMSLVVKARLFDVRF